jgi:hypothetical protein
LPTEITAEVFLQYVDRGLIGGTDPNIPHAPAWTEPYGPLLLASVCRAWKDIALALCPIWSTLEIRTQANAIPTTQQLLECWLPRSGGHPLDVNPLLFIRRPGYHLHHTSTGLSLTPDLLLFCGYPNRLPERFIFWAYATT